MATTDKRINKVNIVTVSAVFLLVLLLSYYCPLITDDLHFKFVWNGFNADMGNEVRVASISDIIESAKNYYNFSGGRVVCHAIVFCLVNLNKWVFAVLNSLMFVLSGILIYLHMDGRLDKKCRLVLPLIYCTVFLCLPTWGDSVLWISGSVNYLWAGTCMLWAIYLIDKDDQSYKNMALTALAVLISASTNEISGGMLIIIILLRMFFWKKKNISYYIICLFCVIPGMGLVLRAPGNTARMAVVDGHDSLSILDILKTSHSYFGLFISYGSILIWFVLIFLFFMIQSKWKFRDIISPMTVTVACFAGAIALGFSGIVIHRALFTVSLPLLIPFWSLMHYTLYTMDAKKRFKSELFAFITLAVLDLIAFDFFQAGSVLLMLLIVFIMNKLLHGALEGKASPSHVRNVIELSLCSALILYGFVTFFIDSNNYKEYVDKSVDALKSNNMEELYTLSPSSTPLSQFFPSEGTIVSDYSVSWIYEYYVVNGGK